MKKNPIYSIILIGGLLFAAALSNAQEPEAEKPVTEQKQIKYTCPMHPEVVKNEPGKCPKCGMNLVEKKYIHKEKKCEEKDSTMMHHEHMMYKKEGHIKEYHMMKDSTYMMRHRMMNDSTYNKQGHMMQ
jgi:hypothetical protein